MAKTMKRKKHETNEDFIVRLINFSKHGAMMQMMMLDGLEKYCQMVVNADPVKFDSDCAKSMIHGPAWRGTCQEYLDEYRKHTEPFRGPIENEEEYGEDEW